MANSVLNQSMKQGIPVQRGSNPMQLMQQFRQFRQSFNGNPRMIVQQMMQSGQITNPQLQNAMQMAKQYQQFIK